MMLGNGVRHRVTVCVEQVKAGQLGESTLAFLESYGMFIVIVMKIPRTSSILLFAFTVSLLAQDDLPSFGNRIKTGNINTGLIDEASGLAASRKYANVLWTHNDAGDSPRIFALTTTGKLLGIYNLRSNARAIDWEDIAIGPTAVPNEHFIYIGDIGNNALKRNTIQIYRIPEPSVNNAGNPPDPNQAPSFNINTEIERFNLRYPDGNHNAETLMVDPISKDVFIIAKTTTSPDSDNVKRVYVCRAAALVTNATITLTRVATVVTKAPGSGATNPTAGDISADGSMIVMKTMPNVFIWPRQPGETVEATLQANPLAPVIATRVKGEAITFAPDGSGYYAVPEGASAPLYFVPRVN